MCSLDVTTRPIRSSDEKAMAKIHLSAFGKCGPTEKQIASHMRKLLAKRITNASFIAFSGKTPAGFILVELKDVNWLSQKKSSYIKLIAVAKQFQGKGLGTKLLHLAVKALKASGYSHTSISVRLTNKRAMKMYEKEGFKKFAVTLLKPL